MHGIVHQHQHHYHHHQWLRDSSWPRLLFVLLLLLLAGDVLDLTVELCQHAAWTVNCDAPIFAHRSLYTATSHCNNI